ncbi:rod shape-determining protein MreD [Thermodesulfobacteriota bacterium]
MTWLFCLFFVLIKGNLMNQIRPSLFDVDLVTMTLAYLILSYGGIRAGFFAFGLGLLKDLFTAGLLGLFTIIYLFAYFIIQLGSRFFDLNSAGGQMIIISLTVFLERIIFLLFLYLFAFEVDLSTSNLGTFVTTAIYSGLLAPILFYFFNRLNQFPMVGASLPSQEQV